MALDNCLKPLTCNRWSNAIYATPNEGTVKVETELVSGGKEILIRVTDTGVGIGPRALNHLFDAGFTRRMDATESDGLGLNWCKFYIESCDGEIVAKSELGFGTEMTVRLQSYAHHQSNKEGYFLVSGR